MNTIISTKPYPCMYTKYERDNKSHSVHAVWSCRINGGSGIAQGKTRIFTPNGVATEIDDEGLEMLLKNKVFQRDVKLGYMQVIKGKNSRTIDVDGIADEMNQEHGSKPLTDKNLKESGAVIDGEDGSIDVTPSKDSIESVAKKAVRRRGKRS